MMVIRGSTPEAVPAGSLRKGDTIMCARGEARVANVEDKSMIVDVSDQLLP